MAGCLTEAWSHDESSGGISVTGVHGGIAGLYSARLSLFKTIIEFLKLLRICPNQTAITKFLELLRIFTRSNCHHHVHHPIGL